MAQPYIRINQFEANYSDVGVKSATGHVNFTFIDGNGVNKGTFGANLKNKDRPSGVSNEESDNRRKIDAKSPHHFSYAKLSSNDFTNALKYAQKAHHESSIGNMKYALACGNCVDFGMQVFNQTTLGRSQLPNYLQPNTAVSIYANLSNALCSGDNYQIKEARKVVLTPNRWRPEQLPNWAQPCIDAVVPTTISGGKWLDTKSTDAWDVAKHFTMEQGTCELEVQEFVVKNLTVASPIVINLDGCGIKTTSIFDQSVQFDLLGIGHNVTSAWIMPTSGFLVYNKQGIDNVTSVNDLFGGSERMEGFFKLVDLDKDKKGYIDKNDKIYASLRIWVNHQMDGISHAGEIYTLQELGVERINTDFDIVDFIDENSNLIGERSTAIINGIECEMSEVYFTYL
ncbi:hypothetical protein [Providencia alcalifaciens]|uniref:hypothetical protein n=1 Tax=Providencia alcalifaciens TaxID=126385 RepID=UPI001E54D9B5|nr:hypothetical protein [Providencia alcalifaciens]